RGPPDWCTAASGFDSEGPINVKCYARVLRTAGCPASLAGGTILMTTYCIRRPMGTWPSPLTLLDEVAFTFVDVETTGLDPATGDRVCEIALLRAQDGREIARFESLVHPQRPMHPGALSVHGITDAMLVGA